MEDVIRGPVLSREISQGDLIAEYVDRLVAEQRRRAQRTDKHRACARRTMRRLRARRKKERQALKAALAPPKRVMRKPTAPFARWWEIMLVALEPGRWYRRDEMVGATLRTEAGATASETTLRFTAHQALLKKQMLERRIWTVPRQMFAPASGATVTVYDHCAAYQLSPEGEQWRAYLLALAG